MLMRDNGGLKWERRGTHSADDIIVVCKVSLTVLAAEDLVGIEVDVVCEAHGDWNL